MATLRNLDIGTLRTIITVVDMAGVTKAANKLNLTQSTVSMQVKRLEEVLGLSLVVRDGRNMRATQEGEQLVSYARKLVSMNDELVDRLTSQDIISELRIGIPFDIVEPHFPRILKQFVHTYPRVSVSLNAENTIPLLDRYNDGHLDLILTTELEAGVGATLLLERELVWTGAINGRAWMQDPLPIAFTQTCVFRKPAIAALDEAGIRWIDAVNSGANWDSGSIACSADLGIRADIKGFRPQGMEPVKDTLGKLPDLPKYCVNMYVANGPNQDIANVFSRLIKAAFTEEVGQDEDEPEGKNATTRRLAS